MMMAVDPKCRLRSPSPEETQKVMDEVTECPFADTRRRWLETMNQAFLPE